MPFEIYRNRVVVIALMVVFLVGFGMFGAIIFIPLFFQGVLGASATSSGSFLTPMMLGIVVSAGIAGQLLSRLGGHYRTQGLIGMGILAFGMFLVSQMNADTSYTRAVINIVVIGLGLGSTFPVFTIAVQNAVEYKHLGVATSATQFYRSIGGTLGLAVLGSFMTSRFSRELLSSIPPDVKQAIPAQQLNDLANNPQALLVPESLTQLRESFVQLGPQGAELADRLLNSLQATLASAISDVFIIAMAAIIVALVVVAFIKELPLRRGHGPGERALGTQSH